MLFKNNYVKPLSYGNKIAVAINLLSTPSTNKKKFTIHLKTNIPYICPSTMGHKYVVINRCPFPIPKDDLVIVKPKRPLHYI